MTIIHFRAKTIANTIANIVALITEAIIFQKDNPNKECRNPDYIDAQGKPLLDLKEQGIPIEKTLYFDLFKLAL